jgi:C4-dicarboxylate transporter, DctM subunit
VAICTRLTSTPSVSAAWASAALARRSRPKRVYPHYAPRMEKASARERLKALAGPWQFILLFVITIGGIYAGVFSPTEAAAIGAFGSIVLGFLGRRLTFATLWRSIETSITTSCLLFVIIIGANLFSSFMVQTQFPTMLQTAPAP